MDNIISLIELADSFYKLASEVIIYTFVPRDALESIKTKGLLSSAALIKDKKALSIARPGKENKFIEKVEKDLSDPETKSLAEGVSGFFTLPDWTKITKKHNISKLKLVPISINLSKLMKDKPGTKLIGVELSVYRDEMSDEEFDDRQKELSLKEVTNYTTQSPTDLWKGYDVTNSTHYASDVPHLIIATPNGKIDAKYINF